MRAREPDTEGFVDRDGVKLHWEVFGDGQPTLLLLPAWTVAHARFWKAQVPYLARHFRVVTYDGPGNGRSDRPLDPAPYGYQAEGRSALDVLDATGTGRAVLVSLSMGAQWSLWLRAQHPGRYFWLEHWEEFLEFFFTRCLTEPHSTKQHEDCVGWGLETTPQVLVAVEQAPEPDEATLRRWCATARQPALVLHGDEDEISQVHCGAALARATGGRLVVLEGAGHLPNARDPVKVNLPIREFVESLGAGRAT
jgi:pimeloyl-ACP methyl ester carboxylesterase